MVPVRSQMMLTASPAKRMLPPTGAVTVALPLIAKSASEVSNTAPLLASVTLICIVEPSWSGTFQLQLKAPADTLTMSQLPVDSWVQVEPLLVDRNRLT